MMGDKLCPDYECGRLAYFLNFGRDEYDVPDAPEGSHDEAAKAAWLRGWDEAAANAKEPNK